MGVFQANSLRMVDMSCSVSWTKGTVGRHFNIYLVGDFFWGVSLGIFCSFTTFHDLCPHGASHAALTKKEQIWGDNFHCWICRHSLSCGRGQAVQINNQTLSCAGRNRRRQWRIKNSGNDKRFLCSCQFIVKKTSLTGQRGEHFHQTSQLSDTIAVANLHVSILRFSSNPKLQIGAAEHINRILKHRRRNSTPKK